MAAQCPLSSLEARSMVTEPASICWRPSGQGCVASSVGSPRLPDGHDQPPLPWMLRDLGDQLIKEIVLVVCLRLLRRAGRDRLYGNYRPANRQGGAGCVDEAEGAEPVEGGV